MDEAGIIKWIVGTGLGVAALVVGGWRHAIGRINGEVKDLHSRIEDVKDNYSRRDDVKAGFQRVDKRFDGLEKRMEDSASESRDAHKLVAEKIDRLIERQIGK